MMRWKVPMPKQATPDGMADVVIAVRLSNGYRMEFEKQMTEDEAREIVGMPVLSELTGAPTA